MKYIAILFFLFLYSCGSIKEVIEQQPEFTIFEIDYVNKNISRYRIELDDRYITFNDLPDSYKVGDKVILSKTDTVLKKQTFWVVDVIQQYKNESAQYHIKKSNSNDNIWIMDTNDSFNVGDTLIFIKK